MCIHIINYNEYLDIIFRAIRPDGTIRWVWMKNFPVKDEKGKVIRRLCIGQDITDIKEAE
jgi:PAS domain S-box-containing protein